MLLSLLAGLLLAPAADTLQAVTVVADRGVVVSRTDTVSLSPLYDAAGTLMQVPGLYVGDYGFGAGLKSVSLRGLGSAHTAIYVDGIRVGNVQSGQNDLGMLGIENFDAAVVDYAQNSVSFLTARPVFGTRPVAGRVRLGAGSFGTWQPYGRLDFRLSDRVSLSANLAGNYSKGDFPLEEEGRRENNDIKQLRGGLDLFGVLPRGDWHAKVYYNQADRGTPGSLSWPSTDTQSDRNFFMQGSFRKQLSDLYQLRISAKGSYDDMGYQSEWGDSDYYQTEFQLNTAHEFRLQPWWTLTLAADLQWDGLKGNVYDESRTGTVVALASAFRTQRVRADIALEYGGTFEKNGGDWNVVSPSADIRLKLIEGLDLVAFGRRAYRVPTFNELYYPGYGNKDLKPEDAWLTDLGLDWRKSLGDWTLQARADGFYNDLKNKIISAPSENPTVWLPYNVGKVQAWGADLLAEATWSREDWKAGASARYGWQKALDKTPDSFTYDEQIPYVARHTLVLTGETGYKGWALSALFQLRDGRRDGSGTLPAWRTLDLSAGKEFSLGGGMQLALKAIARNLLDCRYDIIRDYPMPGRNFLVAAEFRF